MSAFPGRSSYFPWRKDMSPKASLSPPLPMWMVWRKSPSGGLIMSGDKISLRRHFFPFLLLVGFRYMGAFAGMAVTAGEISDMQDRKVGNALRVLDPVVPPGRSSSYILSNTPVRQDSKNIFCNCGIDQEMGFQAGLVMSAGTERSNGRFPQIIQWVRS